jgi:hypothetical protein
VAGLPLDVGDRGQRPEATFFLAFTPTRYIINLHVAAENHCLKKVYYFTNVLPLQILSLRLHSLSDRLPRVKIKVLNCSMTTPGMLIGYPSVLLPLRTDKTLLSIAVGFEMNSN